jgi:hypothetical protein
MENTPLARVWTPTPPCLYIGAFKPTKIQLTRAFLLRDNFLVHFRTETVERMNDIRRHYVLHDRVTFIPVKGQVRDLPNSPAA